MNNKTEFDSSSSEDEICMEAIKEAADQDLLTNLLLQAEGTKNKIVNPTQASDEVHVNNDQFSSHGLTQSCRDFIAKKLVEKLNGEIILEDTKKSSKSRQNVSQKSSGIKLFHSSNAILTTEIINDDDEPKKAVKKNVSKVFDEKANLLRCKEVAIDPQTILSQHDLKFWTDRKHGQEFKYKKSKNGVFLEIE